MRLLLAGFIAATALFAAGPSLKVNITSGKVGVVEIPLEEYVHGVLAGESSVFQSAESLKAIAIIARTYAIRMRGRHSKDGFDLCDTTHCQRLERARITSRLQAAATATQGEMLWVDGKPAFTPYSRDCGGVTEDAATVWPDLGTTYLRNHTDPWCERSKEHHWSRTLELDDIRKAIITSGLRSPSILMRIEVTQRTATARAQTLLLGGSENIRISAGSFRFAIGRVLGWNSLPSDKYEVRIHGSHAEFKGSGSGHGVGLCQNGAEVMGMAGKSYREILAFYYPGTAIGPRGAGIPWQQLRGEQMTLFTTKPDQDRAVLTVAERQLSRVAARTGWHPPNGIELRIYPTIDAYRNATGEPGSTEAYNNGLQVHLQPSAANRHHDSLGQLLGHEFTHLLANAQGGPQLPMWFHEGLAGYISGGSNGAARVPSDTELRGIKDTASVRKAYGDANAMVSTLVQRYGETTVFSWVRTGLPDTVKNASNNQAAPNKR